MAWLICSKDVNIIEDSMIYVCFMVEQKTLVILVIQRKPWASKKTCKRANDHFFFQLSSATYWHLWGTLYGICSLLNDQVMIDDDDADDNNIIIIVIIMLMMMILDDDELGVSIPRPPIPPSQKATALATRRRLALDTRRLAAAFALTWPTWRRKVLCSHM